MNKRKLLNIVLLRSEKSFIRYLHEKNRFSKKRYRRLRKAFAFYLAHHDLFNRAEHLEILNGFFVTFEHGLWLLMCDMDRKDIYQIKPCLKHKTKLRFYNEIREMTTQLVEMCVCSFE